MDSLTDFKRRYRGNCPNAKPRVNALGRRLRTLREAAEAEAVADDLVSSCVEIKILRRVRPPHHRRTACSMAWRCSFLTARRGQHGRVIAEK